jgi:hypothetical protein
VNRDRTEVLLVALAAALIVCLCAGAAVAAVVVLGFAPVGFSF